MLVTDMRTLSSVSGSYAGTRGGTGQQDEAQRRIEEATQPTRSGR